MSVGWSFVVFAFCFVIISWVFIVVREEKNVLYVFITVCLINLHKIAFATHIHRQSHTYISCRNCSLVAYFNLLRLTEKKTSISFASFSWLVGWIGHLSTICACEWWDAMNMWYFRFDTHLNPHSVRTIIESNGKERKGKWSLSSCNIYDAIIKRMTLMIMIFIGSNFSHTLTKIRKERQWRKKAKRPNEEQKWLLIELLIEHESETNKNFFWTESVVSLLFNRNVFYRNEWLQVLFYSQCTCVHTAAYTYVHILSEYFIQR